MTCKLYVLLLKIKNPANPANFLGLQSGSGQNDPISVPFRSKFSIQSNTGRVHILLYVISSGESRTCQNAMITGILT